MEHPWWQPSYIRSSAMRYVAELAATTQQRRQTTNRQRDRWTAS